MIWVAVPPRGVVPDEDVSIFVIADPGNGLGHREPALVGKARGDFGM